MNKLAIIVDLCWTLIATKILTRAIKIKAKIIKDAKNLLKPPFIPFLLVLRVHQNTL